MIPFQFILDSKSIISLTLLIMAVVLNSYLLRTKDKPFSGWCLVSAMTAQCFFMTFTFLSMSTGFWGNIFYGPQFIFAFIYISFMVVFAYHYPHSENPTKLRKFTTLNLFFLSITTALSIYQIYLFTQPNFQKQRILQISNLLLLIILLGLTFCLLLFLHRSISFSRSTPAQAAKDKETEMNSFFLLLHPQSNEALMFRNFALAFAFSYLPAIAQPLISAGIINAIGGFYLYSVGLLVQLLLVFFSYVNRTCQSISFIYKFVSISLGFTLFVLGGVAWSNVEITYKMMLDNLNLQMSQIENSIQTNNIDQLPENIAYLVSWKQNEDVEESSYRLLYTRSDDFELSSLYQENLLQKDHPEQLKPYPQSAAIDTLERLESINKEYNLRYGDRPPGSFPRYIGYLFDHAGRRYEAGIYIDDIMHKVHDNMLPMVFVVIISSLAIWFILPLLLRNMLVYPLNRLIVGVEQHGNVNLAAESIPVQYEDEIGSLTRSFNRMMETIKNSQAALVQINNELEERVAARTAELSESNIQLKNEIVERKRIEKELIIARDAAEAATRAKSDFLAMMSHEIRTPLNAVIGMTSLLADTRDSSEQEEYIEIIQTSSDNLLAIINQVLDFSKIDSGSMILEQHTFHLEECIEEVLDIVSARHSLEKIDLLYNIDPEVPVFIEGDITRLRQVLVNLVDNAIKFTRQGEVVLTIEKINEAPEAEQVSIDSLPDDNTEDTITLLFSIHDTGIGISQEHIQKLFKPFSQADASTTRKYGGTGLGLVISSRLIEIMGGQLSVSSQEGKGSTFNFTITVLPSGDSESISTTPENQLLKDKSILIVEDNLRAGQFFTNICRRWQMKPISVTSASQALHQLQKSHFDVILIDQSLPERSAIDLAKQIQYMSDSKSKSLPTILHCHYGSQSSDEKRKELELFSACLAKPLKASQLQKVLFNLLTSNLPMTPEKTSTDIIFDAGLAERLPLRILVVEDNPVNQHLAIRLFEKLGYQIDMVSNGFEVFTAVGRHDYDIIFMDIQMPGMDGLETTRRLLENSPSKKPHIVAMTANALEGDRQKCLEAGMVDYISKPVRVTEIQAALERWGRPTSPRDSSKENG